MNNYKNLIVWQKAIEASVQSYAITPNSEIFGLTSQIRRSAVSIAANIAEGACRNSDKEFIQFLGIAAGSAYELDTHFIVSYKIGLINEDIYNNITLLINEIEKMLNSLMKAKKL